MSADPAAPSGAGLELLAGVRVVDLTQALSGPYATLMLADLGADVVKVEHPGRGDDARHWGPPFIGDDAAYFCSINRNKRSVALDLKSATGLAAARRLIAGADVLVENWRPGTLARLGLAPAELRTDNPGLVVCSISGYGQDGPARAGYDQIVQGTSGVMSLTGPAGHPTKWGVPAGDLAAGMFASTAVVAALYERVRTGRGRDIDVAMQDCLVAMLTHQAARYLATGELPPNDGNMHSTIAPYGLFAAADGHVNVCVGNDAQFARLCDALGLATAASDLRFATNPERLRHREDLYAIVEHGIADLPVAEVIARLEAAGVPVGPVRNVAEVLGDDDLLHREMVVGLGAGRGGARAVNTPWKVDGRAPAVRRPPPRLGEHTDELLGERPAVGAGVRDAGPEEERA